MSLPHAAEAGGGARPFRAKQSFGFPISKDGSVYWTAILVMSVASRVLFEQ